MPRVQWFVMRPSVIDPVMSREVVIQNVGECSSPLCKAINPVRDAIPQFGADQPFLVVSKAIGFRIPFGAPQVIASISQLIRRTLAVGHPLHDFDRFVGGDRYLSGWFF